MRQIVGWLPLAATLSGYRKAWLLPDCLSGLSICAVMVPSVIAYAGLAGLPPVTGLYAALLGMLGYGIFASSKQVIVGPDAAIALLVGVVIAPLAAGDPVRGLLLASALAVLVGLILLLTAVVRAGVVADLLSKPVLVGYLTGAALILISTQLGRFVGVKTSETDFFAIVAEILHRTPEWHSLTMGIGIGFVVLQIVLRMVVPKLPGALVAFVLGIGLSFVVDLQSHGVSLVGTVASGLPAPRVPWIHFADLQSLVPGAFAVALLTIPEGILLARAFASRRGEQIQPNQEIAALGFGNLLAGFFQGFPVGASQSRTTINEASGGRTPIAGFAAAFGLLMVLLFLTPLIARLPSVTLAAILIFAGAHLLEPKTYRSLLRFGWQPFGLAIIVMMGVLIAGVLQGIVIGVFISLVYTIGRIARPLDAVLHEVGDTKSFHDLGDDGSFPPETVPGLIAYRFYAPLMFANAERFVSRVRTLIDECPSKVQWFVLDAQAIWEIDVTAVDALQRLKNELTARGISFKIARANRPLRDALVQYAGPGVITEGTLFPSVHSAVKAFEHQQAAAPNEATSA